MNKIKLFIASMLGAIALVFACVLGTRVNAAAGNETVLNVTSLYTAAVSIEEDTIIDGTIFTIKAQADKALSVDGNNKSIDGFSFKYRIKTNGTGSKDYRSIKVAAPSKGSIKVYGMSGKNGTTRILGLYDSNYNAVDVEGFSNNGAAIGGYTYTINSAGDYYLGCTNSSFNIYYVEFIPEIADSVKLSFDSQYDVDGTAATKLRFIGTIEGLATTEYTKIETITFTFDFNGVNDRALSVTQLYLSITGYDQYKAADNKMYFVYQLDNINKVAYKGLSLTNCKLIVVFTDGSSKTETHADIELPATFDNYVA